MVVTVEKNPKLPLVEILRQLVAALKIKSEQYSKAADLYERQFPKGSK